MTSPINGKVRQRMTAPRAAGVAGIIFAVLLGTSIAIMRSALDLHVDASSRWTGSEADQVSFALALMPYAGIAFLWFIGVVRDQFGDLEDKLFATVFLGSGLVFIAMVFVSSAVAGGILAASRMDNPATAVVNAFATAEMVEVSNVFALRMAGVFMLSLGTMWLRSGLMKRWLVLLTYGLALALLLMVNFASWVPLIFPAWTLLISVIILFQKPRPAEPGD
ncbi:MAG: hypothetical protein WAL91_03185 [Propionicimonas sp.]